ncbi:MAG: glycosyltransferase family 1 protein [Deltaproteobacteria bacterium]|nr:glycosyltransferase family 1 protein [Deltaproteobacteria bacterium]
MNVIQVINVRWYNATAWYALKLAKLLRALGHEVLTVVQTGTEPETEALHMGLPLLALDINTANPVKLVGLYWKLKSVIREFRPNIVNCHRGEAFVHWGILRRKIGGFGLVRTRGDQRLPRSNFVNRWLHNDVADAVISTNSPMTNHFKAAFGLGLERLHQIIGGVDRKVFHFDLDGRHRIRAEFGFLEHHFVIGLLGRFDEVKGQRQALEALAALVKKPENEHVRLFLIGFDSATPEQTIRAWINDLGLGDRVRISGRRRDVPACISAADLGLVSSLWSETIARAALEIMSCNVPLIGTRVGVMPDLLHPRALFQPGDVAAMAERLATLARDPGLTRDLAREQARVMENLDDETFVRRTLEVYERVCP